MTPSDPSGIAPTGATMSGTGDEAAELEQRLRDALTIWAAKRGASGPHVVCDHLADELEQHASDIARFLANESTVTEYIDGLVDAATDRAEQQAVWDEDRRWLDRGEE